MSGSAKNAHGDRGDDHHERRRPPPGRRGRLTPRQREEAELPEDLLRLQAT